MEPVPEPSTRYKRAVQQADDHAAAKHAHAPPGANSPGAEPNAVDSTRTTEHTIVTPPPSVATEPAIGTSSPDVAANHTVVSSDAAKHTVGTPPVHVSTKNDDAAANYTAGTHPNVTTTEYVYGIPPVNDATTHAATTKHTIQHAIHTAPTDDATTQHTIRTAPTDDATKNAGTARISECVAAAKHAVYVPPDDATTTEHANTVYNLGSPADVRTKHAISPSPPDGAAEKYFIGAALPDVATQHTVDTHPPNVARSLA